jgi:hypothetical protein
MLKSNEKEIIRKFINGEKDLYHQINEYYDKYKNESNNDPYRLFLIEYMKDDMDYKEYRRLKNIIINNTIQITDEEEPVKEEIKVDKKMHLKDIMS